MADGGYVDRVGLSAWSKWGSQSGPRKAIIHLITSTKSKTISNTYVGGGSTYLPFHGNPRDLSEVLKGDSSSLDAYVHIVRSPKANASFFNLRDFDTQVVNIS